MSPQNIAAISTVMQELAKLPIGTLVFVALILPWVSLLVYTWLNHRMIDKFRDQFREEISESQARFEAVVRMYEDNSGLVKNYERLACEQQNLIISNTTTMQRLIDRMCQGKRT